jgi:hypothetical protein
MKKPTKTDIAISVDTEGAMRKLDGLVEAWCPRCGEMVNSVTTEAAAVLSDVDTHTIDQRITAGMIHRLKTSDGLLLICLNSLLK